MKLSFLVNDDSRKPLDRVYGRLDSIFGRHAGYLILCRTKNGQQFRIFPIKYDGGDRFID